MQTGATQQHRLQVILSGDAVGYSRLMSLDDDGTLAALEAARAVFLVCVTPLGGRIVDTAGDSVLVAFETATGAVQAAQAIQNELARSSAEVAPDRRLLFRIGVHLGDVIVQPDGTLYGEGVNVAARLQALAGAGCVLVSEAVRAAVRPEMAACLVEAGEHQVKNIARPVRAFALSLAPGSTSRSVEDATQRFHVSNPVQGFGGKPAIAVLAFENLSHDPDQVFFAEGISQDVLTNLAMWRWLPVIGRSSSFAHPSPTEHREIGRRLGARYVVGGTVRRSGERVRISAELTDAETGLQLWAARYDRVMDDVLAVQDEIAQAIVGALEPAVGAAERERGRFVGTENLSAWEMFQKATWHYGRLTQADFRECYRYARAAAEKDPLFASPLRYASHVKMHFAYNRWEDPKTALADAAECALEGMRRNPLEPGVLSAYAGISAYRGDFDTAFASVRKAIEINPSYAQAHYNLSWIHMSYGDELDQAIGAIEVALRLSPQHVARPMMLTHLAACHLMAHQLAEAYRIAQMAVQEAPQYPIGFRVLAGVCGALGLMEEGRAALATFLSMSPNFSIESARSGFRRPEDVERSLAGLRKLGWSG